MEQRREGQEYPMLPEEFLEPAAEISEPAPEFPEGDFPEEFHEGKESSDSRTDQDQESEERSSAVRKFRLLKKMGYLVAASLCAVAVVNSGTGVWPDQRPSQGVPLETEEEAPESEETRSPVFPTVPGWHPEQSAEEESQGSVPSVPISTEESVTETAESTPETVGEEAVRDETVIWDVAAAFACEDWASGNGNVIPIQRNGLWGAVNYKGETVLPCEYASFITAPNNHGYFILGDEYGMNLVFSDKGEMVYQSYDPLIISGKNNYILDRYEEGSGAGDEFFYQYQYLTTDGEVIYDTGEVPSYELTGSMQYAMGAEPFYGDRAAVVNRDRIDIIGANGTTIHEIYEMNHASSDFSFNLFGFNGDSCVVGSNDPLEEWTFWNASQQEPYYGDGGCGLSDLFGLPYEMTGTDPESFWRIDTTFSNGYQGFFYDGAYRYIYDTQMCVYLKGAESGSCAVLFDAREHLNNHAAYASANVNEYMENNMPRDSWGIIAVYDEIEFDDTPYMAVRDGSTWFYIDHAGNKVSEDYEKASGFTHDGYALVLIDGKAYEINEAFEIVGEYGEADNVRKSNELLVFGKEGTNNIICPEIETEDAANE